MAAGRLNWIHAAVGTYLDITGRCEKPSPRKQLAGNTVRCNVTCMRLAGKIGDFWDVILGHLDSTTSRFEESFCLYLQGQAIQKNLPQLFLLQSFPTNWANRRLLTGWLTTSLMVDWRTGCLAALLRQLTVGVTDWLVFCDWPVVWFVCLNSCVLDQLCAKDWLTGIYHVTKFCLINGYSCKPMNLLLYGPNFHHPIQKKVTSSASLTSHSTFFPTIHF